MSWLSHLIDRIALRSLSLILLCFKIKKWRLHTGKETPRAWWPQNTLRAIYLLETDTELGAFLFVIIISCLRHLTNNSFTVFQEIIPLQLFIQKKGKEFDTVP